MKLKGTVAFTWLGRAVARAIEENNPYIISHPGYRPMVEQSFEQVLAAFGEPAQPDYMAGKQSLRRKSCPRVCSI